MKRRDFINKAGLGIATGAVAASSLSTPAIAQSKKTITKQKFVKKLKVTLLPS